MNAGDMVTVKKSTDWFVPGDHGIIHTVERGAPKKPYYIWSIEREVGEWMDEDQFILNPIIQ